MLTQRQMDLLLLLHEHIQETGVAPSFEEMKDALNLKSKSGVHHLITALELRGFLRRIPHRARALEIIRLPENIKPTARQKKFAPEVIEGSLGKAPATRTDDQAHNMVAVPVMGRIAAGTPIEAIQNHSRIINVPVDMMSSGEHFALEVRGDSMIDAGILDGDTILIRRQKTVENGDIAVALIDDQEATLKRFRRKGASIALEAANPAYETRILGIDRVSVQGKLIGLIRQY